MIGITGKAEEKALSKTERLIEKAKESNRNFTPRLITLERIVFIFYFYNAICI